MLIVVYQPARVFKAIFLFEGYLLLHKYFWDTSTALAWDLLRSWLRPILCTLPSQTSVTRERIWELRR